MMIEPIDVWHTMLAFASTLSAGYFIFGYYTLKKSNGPNQFAYAFFSGLTSLSGFTFFLDVLTGL